MIYGIGVDLTKVDRIDKIYKKYGDKFINKILSNEEKLIHLNINDYNKSVAYIAKRFAAKESFAKALGTGFRDGLVMKDISILNNKIGKPVLSLNSKSQIKLPKDSNVFISISDETNIVIAYCIIDIIR